MRGRGARGTFHGPQYGAAEEEPGRVRMSPWTSCAAVRDDGGQQCHFGSANGEEVLLQPDQQWGLAVGGWWEALLQGREKVAESLGENGMQTVGQGKPRVGGGELAVSRQALATWVPSAVCLTLQPAAAPGHGVAVPVLPLVCTPAPEDCGCSNGSCREGTAHNPLTAGTAPVLTAGSGGCQPPPSTPPSPGPGKWVCGFRTDAGAFPGAVSCAPCQGGGLAGTPFSQGGTQVPRTPPVSAQAHAARALPTQLRTLPCTPPPACPPVPRPLTPPT